MIFLFPKVCPTSAGQVTICNSMSINSNNYYAYNYASVRMRTAAYGSVFVCVITAITAQRLKCKC